MASSTTIIDAHQHFWDVGPAGAVAIEGTDYGWLTGTGPDLERTFDWSDLAPELEALGVAGTVLVQAADTDGDTDAMLAMAAAHPEILGVVGYVPLEQPEQAAERLDELAARPGLVGIRNLIHDLDDPDFLLRADVAEGLALLESRRIPLDLPLVLPRHIEHMTYLSERFPALVVVIDHLAKPPVGTAEREPWTTLMRAAAANPLMHAKVSGLYPSVGAPDDWTIDDVRPWVDLALELFGPDRLLVGSDWPVAVPSGGYDAVFGALVRLVESYGPEVAGPLLSGTATRVYSLALP